MRHPVYLLGKVILTSFFQAGFQIKLFSYIMFEKFGDDDGVPKNADQHFIETATDWILACFKFFMKNKQLTGPDAQQITDAASFSEKVIFVHESVDAYFGSNLFKKIEPTTTEDNIVSQAKTPLPSVLLSGENQFNFFLNLY